MGGILEHAGIPGFLQDTDQLYQAADDDGQEWREFASAWWTKFGPRWVTAGELLALALERDLLGSIVRDKAQRAQKIRLGKALSTMRDRHLASYRVLVGRNSNAKTAQYRLINTTVGDAANAPPVEQLTLGTAGQRRSGRATRTGCPALAPSRMRGGYSGGVRRGKARRSGTS